MWWVALALTAVGQLRPGTAAETVGVPPRIEAFLDLCDTSRRGAIAQLEHRLRGLKSQERQSTESVRQIARVEKDLQALRANNEPVVPALRFPPEVGAIGRLPRLECHVDRVISEREMLVRSFFSVKVAAVEHFRARGETVVQPVSFLIRGMPTQKSQVGADIELSQVFEITATQSNKTADGRSTSVWILSEFDMKAIEPYFRARRSAAAR